MNTYRVKTPRQALLVLLLLMCCQRSKSQGCPQGFSSHNSRCLLINLTISVSWCDANRACAERGAELVTNWDVIQSLTTIITTNYNVWIGVSDMASERDTNKDGWQYVNGRGIMPNNNSLWLAGDPNNSGGIQDCMRTHYNPPKYAMIDRNCDDLSGYVCEIPDVPLTTTTCGGPIGVGVSGGGRIRWIPAPPPTSGVSNDPTRYCYWERSSVASLRDCAMLAGARAFSRSFLYNKNTKVCHVTEFSDSQTPLEQPSSQTQWVKFLKA